MASFMVSAMPACKSLPGVSLVFLTVPQRGSGEGHGLSPEIQPFLSVICTQFFLLLVWWEWGLREGYSLSAEEEQGFICVAMGTPSLRRGEDFLVRLRWGPPHSYQ